MKVKVKIDRSAPSSTKSDALSKIISELGSKPTISGDIIMVDSWDEGKVIEILKSAGLNYSRSS